MAVGFALAAGGMALQSGIGFLTARDKYRQDQENNKQARLAGDREQALTSVNINRAKDAQLASTIDIDAARQQSRSEAIVAAAASGTAGMSVDDSILDIERNAAKAEANSVSKLNDTIFNLEESRGAIEAKVRSRTILSAKPSAALAGFNTALQAGAMYYGYGLPK